MCAIFSNSHSYVYIYANIYVEYVVKNPALSPLEPFESAAFDEALDAYASVLAN